jgi:hypothetical protein
MPNDEFLAGPHYSEPVWLADVECPRCSGEGEHYSPEAGEWVFCELCSGTGRVGYDPENPEHVAAYRREGVSCFRTPEELIEYFTDQQAVCPLDRAEVVEFVGRAVGIGLDEEPLAIPEKVLQRWTWEEFCRQWGSA